MDQDGERRWSKKEKERAGWTEAFPADIIVIVSIALVQASGVVSYGA